MASFKPRKKRALQVVLVLLLTISLVTLVSLLLPVLSLGYKHTLVPQQKFVERALADSENVAHSSKGATNRLIIPALYINEEIKIGSSISLIETGGVWNKQLWNSSPLDIGNTVIVGHSFNGLFKPAPLFNLSRVRLGDEITILWSGESIKYLVKEKKVVKPTDTYIENNAAKRRLTIYTCTLYDASKRFVLIAEPE